MLTKLPSLPSRHADHVAFAPTFEVARKHAESHAMRLSHTHTFADGVATIFVDMFDGDPECMAVVEPAEPESSMPWRVRVWA
jgi:hypothetical protein